MADVTAPAWRRAARRMRVMADAAFLGVELKAVLQHRGKVMAVLAVIERPSPGMGLVA